jgi:hypothetical protein
MVQIPDKKIGLIKNKQADVAKSSIEIESEQPDARRSAKNGKKTAYIFCFSYF